MIPKISEEVCRSVMECTEREGMGNLRTLVGEWPKTQPILTVCLHSMVKVIAEEHGRVTGEMALRACLTLYKIIDTQMEVNDLNERAEL